MDTELCDDPSLREDHARLEKCKQFFSHLKAEELPSFVPNILELLFDRWSVIRSECGKLLSKIPNAYNEELCYVLIKQAQSAGTWQEVHGAIIGLSALITVAKHEDCRLVLNEIIALCVERIGNVNISIKEASRSCLINIQRKVEHKSMLVERIFLSVESIVSQPNSDTEACALKLDGLLGCLVDNYQMYPELVPQEAESSSSNIGVVGTLRLCALHPASTVRQKAGQIITIFVLSFFRHPRYQSGPSDVPPVVAVVTSLLIEALRSTTAEDWCLQEISLMVAEEIVRMIIELKLDSLSTQCGVAPTLLNTSAPHASPALLQHIFSCLAFLKDHLYVLLSHEQFEVRRMAIQLTPQLARAYILLNTCTSSSSSSTATAAAATNTEHDCDVSNPHLDMTLNIGNCQLPTVAEASIGKCGSARNSIERGNLNLESNYTNYDNYNDNDKDDDNNRSSFGSGNDVDEPSGDAEQASPPTRKHHDFGLRVILNSSFCAPKPVGPKVDLALVTEMVWMNECIKENQHFFEAFMLSEQWKSNSVTKDLQMHANSVKEVDAAHKYWSIGYSHPVGGAGSGGSGSSIGSAGNVSADGYTRNIVDHWSLDVRGRLQEIEKRTHFHRTIKTIVAASVETDSPTVITLLVHNCQSLLSICEHMLTIWTALFAERADLAFTSTLATYHSALDSSGEGGTIISIDFIESFALMDSFLLSVQHRFTQCPDITSCRCVAMEEVGYLISTAEAHRRELCMLSKQWIKYIAQIQCISRSSTHISNRTGITGHDSTRHAASELLLVLYGARDVARAPRDLFSSSLGGIEECTSMLSMDEVIVDMVSDSTLKEETTLPTLSDEFIRIVSYIRRRERESDSKNKASAAASVAAPPAAATTSTVNYPVEQLLRDIQADPVRLTSSLTNAAVRIANQPCVSDGYSSGTSGGMGELAYLQTPSHFVTNSVGHTPISGTAAHSKTGYTPSTFNFNFNSPGGAIGNLGAAGGMSGGSGGSVIHRFQAKDQWNCEAISPLLTCVAGGTRKPSDCIELSAVVVEWISSCIMHPLWLDCRHNARKSLFEALVLLLSNAEEISLQQGVPSDQAVQCLLLLRIERAIAEVLSLRNNPATKPLLDIKSVMCLVRAAVVGAKLYNKYRDELQRQCTLPTARLRVEDRDNGNAVQAWQDLCVFELRTSMQNCANKIITGVSFYLECFPDATAAAAQAYAQFLRQQLDPPPKREPGSPGRKNRSTDSLSKLNPPAVTTAVIATSSASAAVEDDEFSDWDEDSDTDEEQVHLTDQDAAAAHNNLTQKLHEDANTLSTLVSAWRR